MDKKRGKIFSKLVRQITVAAREGGGDPTANANLRLAISKAKAANMPNDNIDRAIKKATGDDGGANYMELVYEGYGPGGVALLIETLTDNKNRTSGEVKSILSKRGGNLGEPGSVAYIFNRKGVIIIERKDQDPEELMELALENGADDFIEEKEYFEITSEPADYAQVAEALEKAGIETVDSGVKYVPSTEVELDAEAGQKIMEIIDLLEDNDDVQDVYANYSLAE